MTVSDAIKRSLRLARIIDAGEDVDAALLSDGLATLNSMLASWSAGRNAIYAPVTKTHTLVSGTASYTIGSGADIDTPRPKRILTAFARLSNIDYDIDVISNEDYQKFAFKTSPGTPDCLYHETTYPNATIYLYPVPDQAYTLNLKLWSPFTVYTTVTESLALPEEYEDAICYNLAPRLAAENSDECSSTVVSLAISTFKELKSLNSQPIPKICTDPLKKGKRSNILGDQ